MPKIIDGLREAILCAARERLLSDGYGAFTVRDLARDCGVSVGTIYDYYPSKNALLVYAISGDWREVLENAKSRAYPSAHEAMEALYDSISSFVARYRSALSQYAVKPEDASDFIRGRRQLSGQLAAVVAMLLRPFREVDDPELCQFIANALLSFALYGDCSYARLAPFIQKLLG